MTPGHTENVLRAVEPELLDHLPPEDPEAVASRRDLTRINFLMGNTAWWVGFFRKHRRPGDRILELGAGDGSLSSEIRKRLPLLCIDGLDLGPRPPDWPAEAHWYQCDLKDFDGYAAYDIVIGNLVLHHFTQQELARIGQNLQKGPRLLTFCEPARRRLHCLQFAVVSRCFNHVTRHDGRVSIAAGFRGIELSMYLRLLSREWRIQHKSTLFGAYRLVALRESRPD